MTRLRLLLPVALALAGSLGAPAVARAQDSDQQSSGKEKIPVFNIVRFEPIIVTLFDSNRAVGLISVTLALQVPTPSDKEEIEAQRVKYVDAFNSALLQIGRLHIRPNRPIDVPLIASALESTANQHHRKGKVRALVLDASTRRLS